MRNQKLSKLRRMVNIILFVIFSLFAFVQLNDPDSIVWFILYAITAFICLYANYKSISKPFLIVFTIGLLAYASWHFSYFEDWLQTENKEAIFGEMIYEKPYLEGSREFLGLIIAASAILYQIMQIKK